MASEPASTTRDTYERDAAFVNEVTGAAAYVKGSKTQPTPCPVAYCRGEAGHGLHDIPACLRTCGPLRPGQGRSHDPACPNAGWVARR